jgi:hypothetical protein
LESLGELSELSITFIQRDMLTMVLPTLTLSGGLIGYGEHVT